MASVPDTLRECHRLRKHLRTLQDEIDRGPRVLKAQQARLAAEEQAHKDHYEAITKLKLKQREDEGTLKQTDARLDKLREQLNSAANQKEFTAKESEITQATAKKTALEDAILTTMGEIDDRTTAIPAVEQKWADAKAAFAQYQVEAKERLERLVADQAASRAELARQEATIPDKVRSSYDYLVKAHGPEAYAAVRGKVCTGCQTGMNDQKVHDLKQGAFLTCPSCGKLLYPEA